MDNLPLDLDALQEFENFERVHVVLTWDEQVRMFHWCRNHAYDCLATAKQLRKINLHWQQQAQDALVYLRVARDVFPLKDKESISIEDILNGKVPDQE